MNRKVHYCGMREVRHAAQWLLEGKDPYIIISILSPDLEQPTPNVSFTASEYLKDVLHIRFHDLDESIEWPPHSDQILEPMSKEQALEIAAFVLEHPETNILVHCEAGISRSAGVADAIAEALGGTPKLGRFTNMHVYHMVQQAFQTRGK